MRITGYAASQRTRKAWVTRRRSSPNVWKRPTGQKVKLRGFSDAQRREIEPVLYTMNMRHPNTDLGVKKIKLAKKGQLEKMYGSKYARVGGMASVNRFSNKSVVHINPKAFSKRSIWEPQGLLAHELGHAAHERAMRRRSYRKTYDKDFYTRQKKKTLAGKNRYEDFAESFRVYHGYPMTRRENKRFINSIDHTRARHIARYY